MQVVSADEAVGVVRDGDTLSVGGVVTYMVPEVLCEALGRRFLSTGHPERLNHYHLHVFGLGADTGLEHFAHPGMMGRLIVTAFSPPYWEKHSRVVDLIRHDAIEVFVVPAGVVAANFRETAARRPGVVSRIGLDTFVDPRHEGGMMTARARASGFRTSELISLAGEEWLFYPAQPIDVSFIRATAADAEGNVTLEEEGTHQAVVAQAMATRASGGTVIVQVKRLAPAGSLDPRLVKLPAMLVDYVVVVPDQPLFEYGVHPGSLAFSGAARLVAPPVESPPFSASTVAAHRAVREAQPGDVINLGAGLPTLELPGVLDRLGLQDQVTISVEHGSLGGVNIGGMAVATHWNPTAIMDSNMTFDFYNGGGLDVAFLGMAQVDAAGNVNVAKAGDMLVGIGGFMDIAQCAKKVVFTGTLRQGGLHVEVSDGTLRVVRDGANPKLVRELELRCYAADWARRQGQEVVYVTERAVFRLGDEGLTLTEVAPGIRVDDVRAAASCDFAVAPRVTTMPDEVLATLP